MMKRIGFALGLLAALAFVLAGCGTTGGSGSSGIGADAQPWPQKPAQTAADRPGADEVPNVPLTIVLRGKSAAHDRLELAVTEVALKYKDQWVPVATLDAIAKLDKPPAVFGQKGAFALLAAPSARVPRRKFTHLRLKFDDRATQLVRGDNSDKNEKKLPLTLQTTTLELGDWTPDDKSVNLLVLVVDGTKVTATADSATLPTGALTVAKSAATAAVSGKLVPAPPNARVDVLWGNTKTVVGSTLPEPQTGAFLVGNLPAGSYRLEIVSPGYRLIEPRKDPILLEDKAVALGELALTKADETK